MKTISNAQKQQDQFVSDLPSWFKNRTNKEFLDQLKVRTYLPHVLSHGSDISQRGTFFKIITAPFRFLRKISYMFIVLFSYRSMEDAVSRACKNRGIEKKDVKYQKAVKKAHDAGSDLALILCEDQAHTSPINILSRSVMIPLISFIVGVIVAALIASTSIIIPPVSIALIILDIMIFGIIAGYFIIEPKVAFKDAIEAEIDMILDVEISKIDVDPKSAVPNASSTPGVSDNALSKGK